MSDDRLLKPDDGGVELTGAAPDPPPSLAGLATTHHAAHDVLPALPGFCQLAWNRLRRDAFATLVCTVLPCR